MMPELYLAPALGAVGKPMFRVHTAGSVGGSTALVAAHLISLGDPQAGPDRGLREAVRLGRHVGAVGAPAVRRPAAGRGGRLLRPAHPRLHAPVGRPRAHRPDGGGQGPAERHAQPLRPPAPGRHRHEDGRGLDDAVGPAPLPRGLPVLRRRRGHGAGRRGRGVGAVPAGLDPRDGHAVGADHVRRPGPGQSAGRSRLLGRRLRPGRHHRPTRADRRGRGVRARSAGTSRCGSRTSGSATWATAGS